MNTVNIAIPIVAKREMNTQLGKPPPDYGHAAFRQIPGNGDGKQKKIDEPNPPAL